MGRDRVLWLNRLRLILVDLLRDLGLVVAARISVEKVWAVTQVSWVTQTVQLVLLLIIVLRPLRLLLMHSWSLLGQLSLIESGTVVGFIIGIICVWIV